MDVTPLAERSTRETQAVSLTMVRQTETGLTGVGGRCRRREVRSTRTAGTDRRTDRREASEPFFYDSERRT